MLLQNTLTCTHALKKSQLLPTHRLANISINLKRIALHLSNPSQNSIIPHFTPWNAADMVYILVDRLPSISYKKTSKFYYGRV